MTMNHEDCHLKFQDWSLMRRKSYKGVQIPSLEANDHIGPLECVNYGI